MYDNIKKADKKHYTEGKGMDYKSDIQIAQETEMSPITEIAKIANVDDKYLPNQEKIGPEPKTILRSAKMKKAPKALILLCF